MRFEIRKREAYYQVAHLRRSAENKCDANGLKGKGYENITHLGERIWPASVLQHREHHVMRHSFSEMMAATSKSNSYLDAVNRSKWINHVANTPRVMQIAEVIHIEGEPCLVHCSDGGTE